MKKVLAVLLSLALMFSFTVSALAVDFTPSAQSKDAPEIVPIIGKDGKSHDAIFHDEKGEEVGYVDSGEELDLVITSGSQCGSAPLGEITVMIDEGERQIISAGNIGELAPSMIVQLEELKASSTDPAIQALEIEDFVVSGMYDVSLVNNGQVLEQVPEGQTITFRVQTGFTPGDVFFVMFNCDGLGWVLADAAYVDENGVLTITVSSLCCMAIVVPGYGTVKLDSNAPLSPRTGNENLWWLLLCGGICFVAAAVVVSKKKVWEN